MATPVFCCGFECGIATGLAIHGALTGTISFDTVTFRTGLRALRTNPTSATAQWNISSLPSSSRLVGRIYVRFATLPSADTELINYSHKANVGPIIRFKQSVYKIYAAVGATLGASGVAVTTGV